MPNASDLQDSFLGGEWSPLAQGAVTDPAYKAGMNVCLNTIPIEQGAAVRRSGTQDAGFTRAGKAGRVIKWDFKQATPYTAEFTDGHLRFRVGTQLATTNDSVTVSSISTANPAVVALATAVTWATGDEAFFTSLGTSCPLLQGRRFTLTKVDTTHFSLADSITGANIDGSTLSVSGLAAAATINRVLDLATSYTSGAWGTSTMRLVQTDSVALLLHNLIAPNQINAVTPPLTGAAATFSLATTQFLDGPYLDPIANSNLTIGAASGVTTLTAGITAWSSTTAYNIGAFVSSGGKGYQSLQDQNVNNTPASSPTWWEVVSLGAPINNGQGFIASDIGRLVRLYSEPGVWSSSTTYASGALVSYNPSGLPNQTTYWSSLTASNTNNTPGTDATHWSLLAQGGTNSPALWTWGKITALSTTGVISGATGTNVGNMTSNGGLAAAFDGTTSKVGTACATFNTGAGSVDSYVGKNYTGAAESISQAVIYPSSDKGFIYNQLSGAIATNSITFNLRASNSAPASASNGTLIGTIAGMGGTFAPLTITSTDTTDTWNYVWIEVIWAGAGATSTSIAQVTFYSNAASHGVAVSCEILGPPLLYSGNTVNTWRFGVYSNTTGYPTCGCYSDNRIWLGGAVPNRFDASATAAIVGDTLNFAPTDQYGNVLASSGISYVFTSDTANPIFWMEPDQQGILCGTQAGEFLIFAPTAGGFAPTNIAARRLTKIGSANIPPVRCEHTMAFVQRYQRNLMEFFPDVFSGKFTAPNLAKRARHLTVNLLQEIAFQYEKTPTIWARNGDGSLIGASYRRDTLMTSAGPTFIGWHRHTHGGGRTFVSLCVGPSVGGTLDAPTFVTLDAGTGLYSVEVLGDIFDESGTLLNAAFLDAAITPSSYSVSGANLTLNGLYDLNGKTVSVWAAGLDCGDYTVASGSVTVPLGDGISQGGGAPNDNTYGQLTNALIQSFNGAMPALVGFTYTSQGQRLRPVDPAASGSRNGPGFAKIKRGHQFGVQVFAAAAGPPDVGTVKFGGDFNSLHTALFLSPGGKALGVHALYSGVHWNTLEDDYSYDSMMCWQVTRPYPLGIVLFGGFRATQDT